MVKKILTGLFLSCMASVLLAQNNPPDADIILSNVLQKRNLYGKHIREYDADVYIKGTTQVLKQNILAKYAPSFIYWDKKGDSYMEALVDVHYESPNHFTQKIEAINGSRLNAMDIQARLMQFLNVNIYNSAIFDDQILLPGGHLLFHYYRFEYTERQQVGDKVIHKIRIYPRVNSKRLISGYFYIVDGLWTIYRFDIRGQWEYVNFRVETEYGLEPGTFLLPQRSTILFHMNLLGNDKLNRYFASFHYQQVEIDDDQMPRADDPFDLSNNFHLQNDSIPIVTDSAFWNLNRPVRLSDYELRLLAKNYPDPEPDSFAGQ